MKLLFRISSGIIQIVLLILLFYFYLKHKENGFKIIFVINCIVTLFILVLFVLKITNSLEKFSSPEKIKETLLSYKGWSYFLFVILEILNIVLLPIPALLLHIAGAAVFGSWIGFLLAFLGVFVGSIIAFCIGRNFGKKIVIWCIGKENTNKYCKILNKKGKIAFILMQILPFFPDDILCFVAGISTMTWKFFIIVMLTIRPIYIISACFFGTGQIIPFCGWGIPVWIAIIFVIILLTFVYIKNKDKIEKWFLKNKK